MQLSGVRPSVRPSVRLSVCLSHPNWPVYADVFEQPPPRLASQRPIWSDMTSVGTIMPPCCYRQPGFDLFRHTYGLMNHFRTGQGPCRANVHKWGLAQSPSCDCGQQQTMNHSVDTCPLTKFEGGLNLLHEADDDAVIHGWNLQRLQNSRNK